VIITKKLRIAYISSNQIRTNYPQRISLYFAMIVLFVFVCA